MAELSTAQAAQRLGVSQRQVQRLVRQGTLRGKTTAGGALLVDALAVAQASRQRSGRGRPWSTSTAWAALLGVSEGIDVRTRNRLRHHLEALPADELLLKVEPRARRRTFRASSSYLEQILAELVPTGVSALESVDTDIVFARDRVEGYIHPGRVDDVVRRFHLVEDRAGNVVLHETTYEPVLRATTLPAQVIGADLAASREARERAAGLNLVNRWLSR